MQIPKIFLWLGALMLGAVLSTQAADNADQAAARAALEAKMQELDTQQPPPATPPAVAPATSLVAPVVASKHEDVVLKPIASETTAAKVANPEPPAAQTTAVEPEPKKVAGTQSADQQAAQAAMAQAKVVKPAKVQGEPVAYPGRNLGLNPITAPALPISASKESQLEALLVKYKADQITPEEYHKQRAEILAAP